MHESAVLHASAPNGHRSTDTESCEKTAHGDEYATREDATEAPEQMTIVVAAHAASDGGSR